MNDKADLIDQLRIAPQQKNSDGRRMPWVLIFALLLGTAGVAFAAWYWLLREPPTVVQVATPVQVSVSASERRASVLDASGYVVARRQATVSAKVTGRVSEVLVEEGMQVSEGQVLARLEDTIDRAQLKLSQAQLDSARSALEEIEVNLTDARRTLRRQTELLQRQLTSQEQVDLAETQVRALEARLNTRKDDVSVAQRRVDLQLQQVDELTIRAPFDGVVIAKAAQPGEMVSPISAGGGFTRTGICTIVDMDSLEVEVDVNEAYINNVTASQPVTAELDAYPNWDIPGEVVAIVPTADRQKATVRVRVGFLEKDARILPDMGVKVRFLAVEDGAGAVASNRPALEIPDTAVVRQDGRNYVFVINGEQVERRAVQYGEQRQGKVLITAGLSSSERVVANAQDVSLADGQSVQVEGSAG